MSVDWINYRVKLSYGSTTAVGHIVLLGLSLLIIPAVVCFCWNEIAVGRQWHTVSFFECAYGWVVLRTIGIALFGRKVDTFIELEQKET